VHNIPARPAPGFVFIGVIAVHAPDAANPCARKSLIISDFSRKQFKIARAACIIADIATPKAICLRG